jgi:molecular chaperone DnaJ
VVTSDLRYERNENDLYSNVSISVLDLIIGTKFDFETISGKVVEVNVKPMTQPFMQLKLHGCGMPILNSGMYGDQIILIKPYIPANIHNDIIDSINKHT